MFLCLFVPSYPLCVYIRTYSHTFFYLLVQLYLDNSVFVFFFNFNISCLSICLSCLTLSDCLFLSVRACLSISRFPSVYLSIYAYLYVFLPIFVFSSTCLSLSSLFFSRKTIVVHIQRFWNVFTGRQLYTYNSHNYPREERRM